MNGISKLSSQFSRPKEKKIQERKTSSCGMERDKLYLGGETEVSLTKEGDVLIDDRIRHAVLNKFKRSTEKKARDLSKSSSSRKGSNRRSDASSFSRLPSSNSSLARSSDPNLSRLDKPNSWRNEILEGMVKWNKYPQDLVTNKIGKKRVLPRLRRSRLRQKEELDASQTPRSLSTRRVSIDPLDASNTYLRPNAQNVRSASLSPSRLNRRQIRWSFQE